MLAYSISILAGLAVLVWSADRFVVAAVSTAKSTGLSPMIIGLTVVSFGTSAPEMIVSMVAALDGASALAVGNAVGSNIANIGLVLAITALISPVPVRSPVIRGELPLLLGVTLLGGVILLDLSLSRLDGVILAVALVVVLILMARNNQGDDELAHEVEDTETLALPAALAWLTVSLLLLLASSKALVWGATGVAQAFGVSDLVIGLTIVAIGTSLPELAASAASALKGHHDIALGNVIGSNIFNLCAVMPIPALIAPLTLDSEALWRDYSSMLLLTIAMAAFVFFARAPRQFGRGAGILMLTMYAGYMVGLYFTSLPA